ncbi:MAG TPA: flavodoxin domain-containing protein [Segeticoccus sp.]|uniref:flavodoxin family protein n=1 Tax=Segeticoccus sp. TaxID=2706531 RepID=UPI002D802E56|nr:flavodoxin domain-containing protein [Segeticoccus sp.]HET8600984.1 flavodoxin domain-containing protein [Segeticoccus sp.]
MPHALVVYESMWGNTAQVARAIAKGLSEMMDVDVVDVHEAPAEPTADVSLVVAGGPTHAFSMSRPKTRADAVRQGAPEPDVDLGIREWLEALPSGDHPQTLATFDTRVDKVRHLPGSAARSAAKTARRRGYHATAYAQSFYVRDMEGPLLDGELDRATAWGRQLAASMVAAAP